MPIKKTESSLTPEAIADSIKGTLSKKDIEYKSYAEQLCDAMETKGIHPPEKIIMDGKIHRFSSDGSPLDGAGWYVAHDTDIPIGAFGCWRLGIKERWSADLGRPLTADEQSLQEEQIAKFFVLQEEETQKQYELSKGKAQKILGNAPEATDNHPYLTRKAVKSHGLFLHKERLVIPVQNDDGQIVSLQFIDGNGSKNFLKGGRTRGCYYFLGDPTDTICIAEGYATAATIHEATGHAVVVAFNAGNLLPVAEAIYQKYPDVEIIVCADDDWKTNGNPGLTKAVEAAKSVFGKLVIPQFEDERPEKATDFNDMAALYGLNSVASCLDNPISDVSNVTDVSASNLNDLGETSTETPAKPNVSQIVVNRVPTLSERPCYGVLEESCRAGSSILRSGTYFFGVTEGKNDTPSLPYNLWICTPLFVRAITRDSQNNNFGRWLKFQTSLGGHRDWAMPMELLAGAGEELRAELLAMGLEIAPDQKTRNHLAIYLQSQHPEKKMLCATQVGWCGDSFVLPDSAIGPSASDVIFQSGERGHEEYTCSGNLNGWQENVSAKAIENSLLMVAISAAFAGPMLAKCNAESGGIHFVGDSSTGKTTIIDAASSVWGGKNFRRSWRTTANGMEGAAALFNDNLFALDEISECDPRDVNQIVYALGNGRGKQRANRHGGPRSVLRWCCSVISSGERTITTTMSEGGYRAKAGQGVRLVDIPARRRFGAWDNLHGYSNGAAFSDALKSATAKYHGHAGRAFLERLTFAQMDFCKRLEVIKNLSAFQSETGEGQDKRVASRFAIMALAGELATEYEITGWPSGAATDAAAEILNSWRKSRGSSSNDEGRQIVDQLAGFIERHGDGRFSDYKGIGGVVRDRAGWWCDTEDGRGRIYLFTAEGMREATKGFDFKRALDVLEEKGIIPSAGAKGERARTQRISGVMVKVYHVLAEKLYNLETSMESGVSRGVTEKPNKNKDETPATSETSSFDIPEPKISKYAAKGQKP